MEIRRGVPDDAGAIAAIHVHASRAAYQGLIPEALQQTFTVERRVTIWRELLTVGDGEIWIAEEAGRPLGWICVGASRDPDADATTGELRAMYVDRGSWRQGIGRARSASGAPRASRGSRSALGAGAERTRPAFLREPGPYRGSRACDGAGSRWGPAG
jgi:hypothetical protein